jgi:methanogenic corrinoid protein MtbC1
VVGLSALLTTTMVNMEKIVTEIHAKHPGHQVFVGGAPVNGEFCKKIGATFYAPDPQGVAERLKAFSA